MPITSEGTGVYTPYNRIADENEEIILKQNTKYILRVTSGTNGNLTNLYLSWYEHTNK